jgi:hypothetical protein
MPLTGQEAIRAIFEHQERAARRKRDHTVARARRR